MKLRPTSRVSFSRRNPADSVGAALIDREALPSYRQSDWSSFVRSARKTCQRGTKATSIVTTRGHGINWSQLHKPTKRTTWSQEKIKERAPEGWELPLGHPLRCQGLVLNTMGQCPRPALSAQSYCAICLESSDMKSIYLDSVGPKTRELIDSARQQRESEGTTLNSEIDLIRALLAEVLQIRAKVDVALLERKITQDQHALALAEVDRRQGVLFDTILKFVDQQRRIEEFRHDVITVEEFARRFEGMIAEYRRRVVDDSRALIPADAHKVIADRHEDAMNAVLDAIWPEAPITSSMRSSIGGNLIAAFSRGNAAQAVGRSVRIEIV